MAHKQFSEADKMLTVYTSTHGKITCLAKGASRLRSRKGGHVELGNWCKLYVARGKNLDILTEVETKRPFGHENLTPTTSAQIYHLLELVDYLTEPRQVNASLFTLLVNFLNKVAIGEDFRLLATVFKIKLLYSLGFFSSTSIKNANLQKLFKSIELQDYDSLKRNIKFQDHNYLKLLTFLDSIIEHLAQKSLKTAKFVYIRSQNTQGL